MSDSDSTNLPQISDAEWTVMRVVWRLGKATSAEVVRELDTQTHWKPKTVQTLIGRLVQKGALSFEQNGRERVYQSAIDERTSEQEASRSFLDRVFEGKLAPFLASFAERQDLSQEDLAELEKILKKKTDD